MEDFCFVKYFIVPFLIALYPRAGGILVPPNQQISNLLNRSNIQIKQFDLRGSRDGAYVYTNLDNLRGLENTIKSINLLFTKRFERQLYSDNSRRGKFQKHLKSSKEFPCSLDNGRSAEVPESVHRLKPGDIDIVAALGDSMTAGTNVVSRSFFHMLTEFRGLSFSGGGQGDWRQYLTLPNILKLYNPNLYGYSSQASLSTQRAARFNVGEPIAMTQDLAYQAYVLIERLRHDRRVDMAKHWKLATLFIGNNDMCVEMCASSSRQKFLQQHRADLIRALTILRDNVPRLLINLVTIPNIVKTIASLTNRPPMCYVTQTMFCSCIIGVRYNSTHLEDISKYIEEWQMMDQQVAGLEEFHKQDFAVIFQPFLVNATLKYLANGMLDYRYFADDCIHFSQFGHATLANALWNNMLQTRANKQKDIYDPFERFECPTTDQPFITTD